MEDWEGKAGVLVRPSAHKRVIFNEDEWDEENISGLCWTPETFSWSPRALCTENIC